MKWGIDNAYLHYQHGQILERLSKPDQAHDAYMAALQSDPHHRESLKAVARILSEGQTGDLAEVAVIIFLLAAHQDPYDPDPWLALAQYLRSRGEMPEALGFAGVGFALAPTNNDVREQMSELYSGWSSSQNSTRLQFAAAAGAAFYKRLAVGGDETSAQMLNRNGKPSLRQRWVSSWSRIQSAITANGDVAVMRDGIREIEELYTRWAAIIPEMRHATWLIGLAHRHLASLLPSSIEKREHRKRAVDCLEMAIERGLPGGYPVPPLWRCELADSQAELGDAYREIRMESEAVRPYEGAISNYEKLIRKQPSAVIHIHASRGPTEIVGDPPRLPVQARAFAGRAEVYAATGRASDSAMDCYEALRLAPLYAYPRFTLARIYREWGQYESAVINLSRLIELDPPGDDRVRARTELARIYRMQAQDGRANEQRVKLLDRSLSELMELTREPFPSKSLDAELHEEIADILLLLGRVDEAIIILRASTDQSGRSYDGLRHARLANLMAQRVQPEEIEQELNIAQTACINEINRKKGTDEEKKLRDELVELTTQLALFYADQQVKIDEAHWAADGALEKARGPAQLSMCFDTYGWVAYQEGNPKAAIRYLEAALKHSGGEARQWAHLAFALEARSTLPRARRLAYSRTRDLDRARDVWLHIVNHFPASDWSCTAKEHLDRIPEHTHLPMPLVHMDRIARTRARSRASRTVDKTY
ncbi:tetratricopeptide repeat protein [Streptomyces sp. NPDC050619]|uniref:tetratricopeptide repeat protein n=1 Tax=Streptomyces sp. NPDC050619 TaxID=3157214 RepID=UPI00342707F7